MMRKTPLWVLALGLASCLALVASPADASVILTPGGFQSPIPGPEATSPVTGGTLSSTTVTSSGFTINQAVYADSGSAGGFGGLVFAYQVVNNTGQPINSVDLTNFTGLGNVPFSASVGYLAAGTAPTGFPGAVSGSDVVPNVASRTPFGGSTISFFWNPTPLASGSASTVFFVRTNAPYIDFAATTTVNVNGSSFAVVIHGPSAVPEPSTLVGLSFGMLLGGFALRRQMARKAS